MRAALSGVTKYESTGGGSDAVLGQRFRRLSINRIAQNSHDGVANGEPTVFIPRQVPLTPGTRGGFAVFVVFIISFSFIVAMERNDGVFWFAEHARQLVGVDDFRRLAQERHSYREYQQWFQYHFLDGMANATTRIQPGQSVVMVGPPRMRQIRFAGDCSIPDYVGGLVPTCLDNSIESEEPFGNHVPEGLTNSGGQWNHVDASVTGDSRHVGRLHYGYSGGGYLLEMKPLLARPADLYDPGSEFYPFAHWKVNVSDLWASGWIDKHTKAIFHDFTLYSSSEDLYANVRVTAEFEGNAAVFHMSINLRVFWLERDTSWMSVQYIFSVFLGLLILGELDELRWGMQMAEKVLVERVVELKYLLRLKELQFGAEHGVPELYKPRAVLKKLAYRLYQVDSSCVHHIKQLNAIGNKIPQLEDHFEDALRMLRASGLDASKTAFRPNPVVTDQLNLAKAHLNELRSAEDGTDSCLKKLQRLRIRWSASVRFYYQTEWNNLDSFNYFLLLCSFCARVYSWSLMGSQTELVEQLNREDPYADENYINFFDTALYFGISFYINSLSAILTWIKLFKFLSFFPQMSIFTKTVALSASHLGVFFIVVLVVLIGSAQGFCLAFGSDIDGFRDPFISVVTISLFTVGKFDYDQLIWSQRWLGPVLFWVYIFLVFFVMMSVFIAILSEGYEAAKASIPATSSGDIWEAVQTVAVTNMIDVRESTRMTFRKVTGKNKAQDRLITGINKVRAGVQIAGALSAFKEAEEEDHIGARQGGRARMVSNKDANIATDSDSDDDNAALNEQAGMFAELAKMRRHEIHEEGEEPVSVETAGTQGSLPGTPAEEPDLHKDEEEEYEGFKIVPAVSQRGRGGRAKRSMTMQMPDMGPEPEGVDQTVAERLGSLEQTVEELVASGEDNTTQLQGLQDRLGAMSTVSGKTLEQIVEKLAGLANGAAAAPAERARSGGASRGSSPTRQRPSNGDAGTVADDDRSHRHHRSPPASEGHDHHHGHHKHKHGEGHSSHQHGHASRVRAKSPGPTHGAAVMRERPSPQSGSPAPVGLGSTRASSNGRSSVPNMRQQLAAMARLKGGAVAAEEKRKQKIPSMREQMAKMSASAALQDDGSKKAP